MHIIYLHVFIKGIQEKGKCKGDEPDVQKMMAFSKRRKIMKFENSSFLRGNDDDDGVVDHCVFDLWWFWGRNFSASEKDDDNDEMNQGEFLALIRSLKDEEGEQSIDSTITSTSAPTINENSSSFTEPLDINESSSDSSDDEIVEIADDQEMSDEESCRSDHTTTIITANNTNKNGASTSKGQNSLVVDTCSASRIKEKSIDTGIFSSDSKSLAHSPAQFPPPPPPLESKLYLNEHKRFHSMSAELKRMNLASNLWCEYLHLIDHFIR